MPAFEDFGPITNSPPAGPLTTIGGQKKKPVQQQRNVLYPSQPPKQWGFGDIAKGLAPLGQALTHPGTPTPDMGTFGVHTQPPAPMMPQQPPQAAPMSASPQPHMEAPGNMGEGTVPPPAVMPPSTSVLGGMPQQPPQAPAPNFASAGNQIQQQTQQRLAAPQQPFHSSFGNFLGFDKDVNALHQSDQYQTGRANDIMGLGEQQLNQAVHAKMLDYMGPDHMMKMMESIGGLDAKTAQALSEAIASDPMMPPEQKEGYRQRIMQALQVHPQAAPQQQQQPGQAPATPHQGFWESAGRMLAPTGAGMLAGAKMPGPPWLKGAAAVAGGIGANFSLEHLFPPTAPPNIAGEIAGGVAGLALPSMGGMKPWWKGQPKGSTGGGTGGAGAKPAGAGAPASGTTAAGGEASVLEPFEEGGLRMQQEPWPTMPPGETPPSIAAPVSAPQTSPPSGVGQVGVNTENASKSKGKGSATKAPVAPASGKTKQKAIKQVEALAGQPAVSQQVLEAVRQKLIDIGFTTPEQALKLTNEELMQALKEVGAAKIPHQAEQFPLPGVPQSAVNPHAMSGAGTTLPSGGVNPKMPIGSNPAPLNAPIISYEDFVAQLTGQRGGVGGAQGGKGMMQFSPEQMAQVMQGAPQPNLRPTSPNWNDQQLRQLYQQYLRQPAP